MAIRHPYRMLPTGDNLNDHNLVFLLMHRSVTGVRMVGKNNTELKTRRTGGIYPSLELEGYHFAKEHIRGQIHN